MIRLGTYRHQVRVEQRSTMQDASGELAQTWIPYATRRAAVQATPGGEVWASAQRSGRVPTVFKMRWFDGLTPAMRIIWGTKTYNVLSVVDQGGNHEELIVTAEELVGES